MYMSYPTYQQTEELKIGQVELTSYSDLECVHLQVEYSLETKDVLALISYCIDNHCGISLYSKSQEDAAKLEGIEIHRNSFPLNSNTYQANPVIIGFLNHKFIFGGVFGGVLASF